MSIRKTVFFALFLAFVATLGFAAISGPSHAKAETKAEAKAGKATAATLTVEQIGPLVREYLMANPAVVIEAVELYQKQQEALEAERQKESLKTHSSFLYQNNPDASPAIGNPKGDVTIVEFLDYNCGYCKRAFSEVQSLLETDKNIRVVFKEMPILSPTSHLAAQWALAAQRQNKYFEFHEKLMKNSGAVSEESLAKIATDLGLDVTKMKKDAADPKVSDTIAQNISIAQELGVRGTPAFIINDRLIGGYIPLDEMKKIVADVRAEATKNGASKN